MGDQVTAPLIDLDELERLWTICNDGAFDADWNIFEDAAHDALPALLAAVRAAVALSHEANNGPQWPELPENIAYVDAWKDRYSAAFKALDAALAPFRKEKADD